MVLRIRTLRRGHWDGCAGARDVAGERERVCPAFVRAQLADKELHRRGDDEPDPGLMVDESRGDDQAFAGPDDALPIGRAGDTLIELEVVEADAEVESLRRQLAVRPCGENGDARAQRRDLR